MKTIVFLIGARPNYMKLSPLLNKIKQYNDYKIIVIHSGQHYDVNLKDNLIKQLNIDIDINLKCDFSKKVNIKDFFNLEYDKNNINNAIKLLLKKNYSELGHIGSIIYNLKLFNFNIDLFVVFGDVDTSLAGALFAYINKIKLAHIEAGLRSFDLNMPEEINRIIIDHISDYLFITEWNAMNNLNKENIFNNIYMVGNLMHECLFNNLSNIKSINYFNNYDISKKFILLTLHRPSNVDNIDKLFSILNDINNLGFTVYYPVHPRIKVNLLNYIQNSSNKLSNYSLNNFIFFNPLPYFDFIFLLFNCLFCITDSGGIQDESHFIKKSSYILRNNTERPSYLKKNGGYNILINNIKDINLNDITPNNINDINNINIDTNVSHKIINIFNNILQ